jgi:biopolymer transport protein ExbD
MPLNGLHKVTVNGVDKSEYIRNGAIAVHTRVMDEGQIIMDSASGSITIKSPAELEDVAVRAPSAT